MSTILVTVTKFAEVEVDTTNAREDLIEHGWYSEEEVEGMNDEEVAEAFVSYAEGCLIDMDFERTICAVTTLRD